jgi:WD40 repeat protein
MYIHTHTHTHEHTHTHTKYIHIIYIHIYINSPFARNLAATGGGDDAVTLWDVADAEEGEEGGDETKSGVRAARATRPRERSLENATFGDSVVGLSFSHDGTYLAAAGMDG